MKKPPENEVFQESTENYTGNQPTMHYKKGFE